MVGSDSAKKDWDRVYGVNVIAYSNGKVWLVTDLIYLLFVRFLTKDL